MPTRSKRAAGGGDRRKTTVAAVPCRSKAPKPPPPIFPASEAAEKMTEVLPLMLGEIAPLFGKRAPRVSRKKSAAMRRGLRRYFAAIRPYAIAMEALKPSPNRLRFQYALLEGQQRELLRAFRRPIGDAEDSFAVTMQVLEKQLALPRDALGRDPAYRRTRRAVTKWANRVATGARQDAVRQLRSEWSGSTDARAFVRLTRRWIQLAEKLPERTPKRVTEVFVERLAKFYFDGAAGMERCLRLMVALVAAANGQGRSWPEWRKVRLAQLPETVKTAPELARIARLVDRHVRNALAHGLPEFDAAQGRCRFYDGEHEVAWTAVEFLQRTRSLVHGLGAMLQSDNMASLAHLRVFTRGWWTMLAADRTPKSGTDLPARVAVR